jgi:uncharacterized lipoprotein YehR (DUF1307 family)
MKKLICMILAVFLLVSLAACQDAREGDYVLATNALESGRYADAYPILAELGDYKDAKALLATIHAEKQSAVVDIDGVHMEIEYVIKNGNVVKEIRTVSGGDQIKSYYKFNAEGLCTSEIHAQADGSKVKCTPAQAKAWSKWRDREHMSLDEVKALKPEITDAGREYVKAHPLCTRKEAAANGCKNITKEGLKALKVELGFKR